MSMYNPSAYNYNHPSTFPSDQNFNIVYGHPGQMVPQYGGMEDPMHGDHRQDFTGNRDPYTMKNPSDMRGDYNYNQPFQGRSYVQNERGDNFHGQRYRQNDQYYDNGPRNDQSHGTVLPESKRIFKPGARNPRVQGKNDRNQRYERYERPDRRERHDSRNFGDQSPMSGSRNFSKPGPRRQEFSHEDHKALNSAMFYKTKMCPQVIEKGVCPRGETCCYAHSESELRQVPNLKKTKLCHLFQLGKCNRGNMCSFAHGEHELRSTPEFYKTSICNGYLKGSCRAGENCRYAHGKEELRSTGVETHPNVNPVDSYNASGFAFTPYPSLPPFGGEIPHQQPNDWLISNGNEENINNNFPQPNQPYFGEPAYMNYYQGMNKPESVPMPVPESEPTVKEPQEVKTDDKPIEQEAEKTDKEVSAKESTTSKSEEANKTAEETPIP